MKVINVNPGKSNRQRLGSYLYADTLPEDAEMSVSACTSLSLVQNKQAYKSHFWRAVAIAHDQHYPLVMTPESVWLTIIQGFARSMDDKNNPLLKIESKKRRDLLGINFDGVREIIITESRTDNSQSAWLERVSKFSKAVKSHIGESKYGLFFNAFSQSNDIEKTAISIAALGLYKSYFNYTLRTLCGIPYIAVMGNRSDWEDILNRISYFKEFGLDWWVNPLSDVISHFVALFDDDLDLAFWKKIYSRDDVSGVGPITSGWVNVFFPFVHSTSSGYVKDVKHFVRNEHLETWKKKTKHFCNGTSTNAFPESVSSVPFKWDYIGKIYQMEMSSGIIGVSQHQEYLAIRPEIGFNVREVIPK